MMNIFDSFSNPAKWLVDWALGYDSDYAERRLTSEKALSYAPIWYGVNKIAGHIAQLPVGVFKRLERGAERDRTHNVAKVMRRPNPYQTSIVFREQIATHSLLDGNGRAGIVRAGTRVAELIALEPSQTTTAMIAGVKVHATRPDVHDRLRMFYPAVDGKPDGVIMLDDMDVLHIPGLTLDGIHGIALRKIGQRSIGASINAEKRLAAQMEKGFAGNLMLQAPPGVFRKQEDAEQFLEAFEKRHNSPGKAGKPGLLREGMTASVLTMNNKDAEMIDNRRFQRQDAALWLGLESILGDDSSVSYNSLEQKNLAYLMNTLNKWLTRWEQEMEYKLLPTRQYDADTVFIRFITAALLKSDYKTSVESLALAITSTIMSPNEARDKLDMNPYEGGDAYQNPAITPGNNGSTFGEQMDDAEDATEGTSQASLAAVARVAHMIGVEAVKVTTAAAKAHAGGNYVEWLDEFYTRKWQAKLADIFEAVGIDRQLATDHCEESKRRLLDVCGESTPEELADNVRNCVKNWKSRANTIGVAADV